MLSAMKICTKLNLFFFFFCKLNQFPVYSRIQQFLFRTRMFPISCNYRNVYSLIHVHILSNVFAMHTQICLNFYKFYHLWHKLNCQLRTYHNNRFLFLDKVSFRRQLSNPMNESHGDEKNQKNIVCHYSIS